MHCLGAEHTTPWLYAEPGGGSQGLRATPLPSPPDHRTYPRMRVYLYHVRPMKATLSARSTVREQLFTKSPPFFKLSPPNPPQIRI